MLIITVLVCILLLNAGYISCKDETDVRHKGICQFSLNSTDYGKLHYFDLTRVKSKHVITKYQGSDVLTYLSICELYTNNRIQYENPCEKGNICFLNGSEYGFTHGKFSHEVGSIVYNETQGYLNITFTEYGHKKPTRSRKVTIAFMCSNSEKEPEFISEHNLQFHYKWDTPSACPVSDLEIRKKCIFQPDKKQYSFDLRDLRKEKFYTVVDNSGGKRTLYVFNICGTVRESTCSDTDDVIVCNVTEGKPPNALVNSSKFYELQETGEGVKIIAHTKKHSKKVNFNIICDEMATPPYYITVQGDLTFAIRTPLSCIPPYYRCVIKDGDRQYDLTALRLYARNRIVNDDKSGLRFVINVCGYLNDIDFPEVHRAGKLFAYVVDRDEREEIYDQFESLIMVRPGYLEMTYIRMLSDSGKRNCSNGKGFRSLLIKLFCSNTDSLANLKFNQSNLDSCNRELVWRTKNACPFKIFRGIDCVVQEDYPTIDVSYNYTSLRGESDLEAVQHYPNVKPDYKFRLNICGPLYEQCNNDTTASVCWHKYADNREIVIGRSSSNPISKQGEKYFEMIGDACYFGGPISRVFLYMKCNYVKDDSHPRLLELVEDDCLFIFQWYVKSACASTFFEDSTRRRFKRLSFGIDNYLLYINETSYFALNIGHSLIRNANILCYEDAVACFVNLYDNESFKYSSETIGRINGSAHSSSVVYWNTKFCNSYYFERTNYSFECYPYLVNPLVTFESFHDCTYFFKWKTRYGCSPEKLQELEKKSYKAVCAVVNRSRLQRYNFDKLANIVWNVTSPSTGHTYSFIICGEHRFQGCVINNGVCVRYQDGRRFESGGELSSQQVEIVDDGSIKLTYSGGDSCVPGKFNQRKTVVKLLCSYSPDRKLFVLDELDNCTVIIVFMLPDVCSKQTSCLDYDIRLKSDMHFSDIWSAFNGRIRTENGDLILNACSQRNDVSFHRTWHTNKGWNDKDCNEDASTDTKILGFQTPNVITVSENDKFVITFTDGSLCTRNSSYVSTSAELILKCDLEENLLFPNLIDHSNDCHFVFEWGLTEMCEVSNLALVTKNGCFLKDEITGDKTDLQLFRNKRYSFRDEINDTYFVDICGYKDGNVDGYLFKQVANTNFSYGNPNFASFFVNRSKSVILFYNRGEPCDNFSSYYAQVRLVCGAHQQQPKIVQRTNCSLLVEWKVDNLCDDAKAKRHPTQTTANTWTESITHDTTSFHSNHTTMMILVYVTIMVIVVILIFRYLKKFMARCPFGSPRGYHTPPSVSINFSADNENEVMYGSTVVLHNRRNHRNLQSVFTE